MLARRAVAVVASLVLAGGAGGFFLLNQEGSSPKRAIGTLVAARRGVVERTVGGVGHITTLTGAALLSVPSAVSATAPTTSTPTETTATPAGATGSSPSSSVPADAVFAAASGHIAELLVRPGERVAAGQPVAKVSDAGISESAVMQARSDLSTARLELAQKRVENPALGVPPTSAELRAGQQAVIAAKTALRTLRAPPPPAEVAAARAELSRSVAELHASRATPRAISVAELEVMTAKQALQKLLGPPDPAEVAAAQLEVANALVAQTTLAPEAIPAETAAAQLAVTVAQLKLEALLHPPPTAVTAAQGEVAKAELDLEALRATHSGPGLAALRAAVAAAKAHLAHLRPTLATISTAQAEVRKARADLAILRQRGAPASATEQALARLKVVVGEQRLALAKHLASELTVRAPAAGTVTGMLTALGAPVDPSTPLMRVQDLGNLVVALQLSEFDVAHVKVGEPTRVSVDALGGRQIKGAVIDISPVGTEIGGVVNFPVTIALQSGSGASGVRPGMSVSARIVTKMRRDVLRVPAAAVSDGAQPAVMVREAPGKLKRRSVKIGLRSPGAVEVRFGLRAGAQVFVPGGGGE
jgi:HlyD family secretion protein